MVIRRKGAVALSNFRYDFSPNAVYDIAVHAHVEDLLLVYD